ncbi:MAG: Rieske 2Fe-2S domain-containing protein [Gammaproteobacteria bacterium]|nr:Rieske 2Fe-2S domain-containing protein [Gammaproteobacteria bacterium]
MRHKLCHINDISDPGSREFSLQLANCALDFFVVHKDGQFFAYKNSCPHTGASLNWQENQFLDMDNAFIQCSVHNALFEVDSGYCIAGPCSGSSMEELTLIIENNELYLKLSDVAS